MSKIRKVGMDMCHGVADWLTHCSFNEICYKLKHEIQPVEVVSFEFVSNYIVSIQPVDVSQNVPFPKVDVCCFSSAISADVHQEIVTSTEYKCSSTCLSRAGRELYETSVF